MTATTSGRAAGRSRAPRRPSAGDALGWVLVGILAVLIGLPLAFVLLQAVLPGIGLTRDWGFHPELLGEIANRPLWQRSLANSLVLSIGAMLLGGGLGLVLALLRHTVAFPGARLLDIAAWVLLVTPSFVLAQGWVLFASPSGVAATTLGLPWVGDVVLSPVGLVLVMGLIQYPLAYLAVSAALHWDDPAYRHAAALSGARGWTILRTVRMPLLLPAAASGAVLVFVEAIGDFGLPAALSASYSFPTLPYSIYASVRQSPVSFALGGVLSFYLVVILAIAVLGYLRLLRRGRYDFLTSQAARLDPPPARRPALWTAVTIVVLLLTLGIPLGASLQVSLTRSISGGLTPSNLTLEHYGEILAAGSRMADGAAHSLLIAAAVAIITTVLGLLIGVVLTFTRFRGRALLDVTGVVALAIPGIVLAVGYIFVWNQPALEHVGLALYGRPELLVLAGVATSIPVAVRLQMGALAQVPASFLQAAALSGAGLGARLRTVLVPLVAPALLSALLAVFASGVFDLAATTMLAPPDFVTLPVEIVLEYDRGRYGYATAGALLTAAAVVALAALGGALGRRLIRAAAERRDRAARPADPAVVPGAPVPTAPVVDPEEVPA